MKKLLASLALAGSLVFVTGCSGSLDAPTRAEGVSAVEAEAVAYKNTKPYTVKKGDTLYKISMRPQFKGKTSWWNIAKANKLRDPYRIYVGQKLRIPVTVSKTKPKPVITPKPSPTATAKPTPKPSPTPTAAPKPSPSPTVTPSPTAAPTPTPSPSECRVWSGGGWLTGACPSPSPTQTPAPSPTPTTPTPAPTSATPTPTPSPSECRVWSGGGWLTGACPVPSAPAGQMKTGFITGYSMEDNDPVWSKSIAYSSEWDDRTLHTEASGTGTYDDPITLAAQVGDYTPGTRFYIPHVDRYFMLEDSCASCGGKPEWIDMYIGGNQGDSVEAMDKCMASLTGDLPFEVNPPRDRFVVAGPLFDSATDTCYKPTP